MKVVTPNEMAAIESHAYKDGSSEENFMEEAGKGIAITIHQYVSEYQLEKHATLLCGKGNNTGDAYVAGTFLAQNGYTVTAFQLTAIEESSPLCQKNYKRFIEKGGKCETQNFVFPSHGIIVDGLFGTGFHGTLEEPFASVVIQANESRLPIISIDIPSGLNGETGKAEGHAIVADETIFLGLPKTGFFLNDGWNYVGDLSFVNFGLPSQYVEEAKGQFKIITSEEASLLLPPMKRNRHKYQAGHVVGLAGSPGMPGAALLAASSTLCSGAGMIHLLHMQGMETDLSSSPFEVIKIAYSLNQPDFAIEKLNSGNAAFIGPGIGRTQEMRHFLKSILSGVTVPCVIDADALTIIAEENIALPKNAILTPHHGEMARLLNPKEPQKRPLDVEFLKICQEYAAKHDITLVLKGGPTFIFHPTEPCLVNPTGSPGMATAGSGDVLTGILAALLAQGLTPYNAAKLGVYLHGLAGEYAESEETAYCMLASDIIHHLPNAFANLQ